MLVHIIPNQKQKTKLDKRFFATPNSADSTSKKQYHQLTSQPKPNHPPSPYTPLNYLSRDYIKTEIKFLKKSLYKAYFLNEKSTFSFIDTRIKL